MSPEVGPTGNDGSEQESALDPAEFGQCDAGSELESGQEYAEHGPLSKYGDLRKPASRRVQGAPGRGGLSSKKLVLAEEDCLLYDKVLSPLSQKMSEEKERPLSEKERLLLGLKSGGGEKKT